MVREFKCPPVRTPRRDKHRELPFRSINIYRKPLSAKVLNGTEQKVERDGKSLELGAFPAERRSRLLWRIIGSRRDDLIIAPLFMLCFHLRNFTFINLCHSHDCNIEFPNYEINLGSGIEDG